jgi:hypothetical protein
LKVAFVEWLSASDHNPVIAKQQSPQSGDGGDSPDVTGVVTPRRGCGCDVRSKVYKSPSILARSRSVFQFLQEVRGQCMVTVELQHSTKQLLC